LLEALQGGAFIGGEGSIGGVVAVMVVIFV
jgi:hypothetical protein